MISHIHIHIQLETKVYNCSLSVCRNAQKQPFNYICKYFNIDKDEDSLEHFEELLNNFSAVEDGKENLVQKKKRIIEYLAEHIKWRKSANVQKFFN